MIKEVVKEAKTIEEAIELACTELEKTRDEVNVEILERPKKGFLGIGSVAAKVRVFYEVSEKKSEKAVEFLKSILDAMGMEDYTVVAEENEQGINIQLEGEKLGSGIIGHRGETLDAIQYLVSLYANRIDNKYTRITIDTGNYREKREKTLQNLARKIAINVVKTGRSSTLEPMNPYERRIIHAAVSQIEGATSTSVGEEPNRKVIISSVNGKKPYNKDKKGSYKGKRRYNNNKGENGYSGKKERFKETKVTEEAHWEENATITKSEVEESSSLYSKIEL